MKAEEMLDQTIRKLKAGSSQEESVSAWSERNSEALPLAAIAKRLLDLPKKHVPEPVMQRKYLLVPAKRLWLSWLPVSRMFGLSMSFLFLFTVLAGTGYATLKSVPGEPLFGLKKSSEKLQFKFASSPEKKASFQIELAKKRLVEAEKIIKSPDSTPKKEEAALNELMAQTRSTIETVDNVAKASTEPQKNNGVIASLEDITKKQQALIQEMDPQEDLSQETKLAIAEVQVNASKINEIKRYIQTASNEQGLAILEANPNSISLSGALTEISDKAIAVEKTAFSITDKTVIKDTDGNSLTPESLRLKSQVKAVGYKEGEKLLLTHMTVLDSPEAENEGEVKGTTSGQAASSTPKTNASSTPVIENNIDLPTTTPVQEPGTTVTGSFIFEDPSPQSAY